MSGRIEKFRVSEDVGERLDVWIAERLADVSRSAVSRLIESGCVLVNGGLEKPSFKVRQGDEIKVVIPEASPSDIVPEDLDIEIIYEDEDVVVVNKPRGMTTHPAPGSPSGTLANALLAKVHSLSGVGGVERPGIVHRLDKDTSGLIAVAKNDLAHRSLQQQLQKRTAGRVYLALVWGETKFEKAIVDAPIGRHPSDRKKMAVVTQDGRGRQAVTDLSVKERFKGFTLLEASLRTGRTHQIRVHCSYIGHPVVGDPVYGGNRRLPAACGEKQRLEFERLCSALGGQALHAYKLSFDHPVSGERLSFECDVPKEMQALIDWLRENKTW
jgi:23S rRNA pseudouridine1911/1915/1917 synthase